MFFTTKGTLCAREGMFSAMFSGRHKLADEDEQFIDRDPTHFKLILNYLRNGTLVLPACPGHLNEVCTRTSRPSVVLPPNTYLYLTCIHLHSLTQVTVIT